MKSEEFATARKGCRTHCGSRFFTLPSSLFIFLSLISASCGTPPDRFRLEGRFEGLDQGEFYLYSFSEGHQQIDTLRLNNGHLSLDREATDTCVLLMLFPNFSEVPVIAAPGTEVKIEGNATHLKETKVLGGVDNDLLTRFRLAHLSENPAETTQAVSDFVGQHPLSQASLYLIRRHLLLSPQPQHAKALQLLEQMKKQGNTNVEALMLRNRLRSDVSNKAKEGRQLPAFSVKDIKGNNSGASYLRHELNVVYTWSSWSVSSQEMQRRLRKLKKSYGERLGLMGFCLDADTMNIRFTLRYDSITWPIVCSEQLFQSDVLKRLSLFSVPDNRLYDARGKLLAHGLNTEDLEQRINKLLTESSRP